MYEKLGVKPSRNRNKLSHFIGKHQVTLGNALNNKIVELCAKEVSVGRGRVRLCFRALSASKKQVWAATKHGAPLLRSFFLIKTAD